MQQQRRFPPQFPLPAAAAAAAAAAGFQNQNQPPPLHHVIPQYLNS